MAHRGKLGKRRRPSRVYLKANLVPSPPAEDDETRLKIGKKLKNEDDKSDNQKNGNDCITNEDIVIQAPVIKHGPKGTVIEIGTRRGVEFTHEDDSFTGPVIKGAILKIPESVNMEKQSLDITENGLRAESDDEILQDDSSSRRWKSLPSLCHEDKNGEIEEKEDAPWVHQVKLRHVEDPESPNRRGCSMLFFGPLPKPPHDGSNGRVTTSDNDSQFPQIQLKSTDAFRPVRIRPTSLCDHVQIQTWDRRHLTATSRTNSERRKNDSKFRRSDPTRSSKIWQEIPQITDALINNNEYPEDKEIINKSKTKKRWKTDTFENGVHRSKSLNGIDKDNQPEWIELSKKVTSKNIDWENLPTANKCSQGKSLQSELRFALKKFGNQLNTEPVNEQKSVEKEEIVLKEDDLPAIRNGLTRQEFLKISSKRFSHWEKLDNNANSQCQKRTVPSHDPVSEPQKQNSLGNGNVSWIKEAEKRRQKYRNWQCQAVEETKTEKQEQDKDSKEVSVNISRPLSPTSNTEIKKEEIREESSPFPVKLRRVRCAKPEECFHEVKCTLPSTDNNTTYEERASPILQRHSPVPSLKPKKGCDENKAVVHNGVCNGTPNLAKQSTGESFSVQLSDHEGDNFYVVINEQDDDSFLQTQSEITPKPDNFTLSSFKNDDAKDEELSNDQISTKESNFKVSNNEDKLTKEETINDNNLSFIKEDSKQITNGICLSSPDGQTDDNSENILDVKENEINNNEIHKISDCNGTFSTTENGIVNGKVSENESIHLEEKRTNSKEAKQNGFIAKKTKNGIQETYENLTINGISAIPIFPRKVKKNHKEETIEEKAARMTNDICGVLSSLGRQKTEQERQSLHRDILKTLTCPTIHQSVDSPSRTLTLVTCDGDGLVASSVKGRLSELSSVGVQTNCDDIEQEIPQEKKTPKKIQTRIKKKTVKIIIHECDDDEDKQEVVEEIVEQILEPRLQKGKMVRKQPTICRAIEETEDGQKYLATTVTDGCTFCIDDNS